MKLNRDITIALLKTFKHKFKCSDPLAGTGIRSLRIIKEVENCSKIFCNDRKYGFRANLLELVSQNNIDNDKLEIFNEDANKFLLNIPFCDYIDIDPFGTPVLFLEMAVRKLRMNGIIAVTATDTAALCGTSVRACLRKYWAKPLRNSIMKEVAIRILIRRVQLVGAANEVALEPIICYSEKHYHRVFLRRIKGSSKIIDTLIKKNCEVYWNENTFYTSKTPPGEKFGPLWTGELQNKKIIGEMCKYANGKSLKLLEILNNELDVLGFYDTHAICKKLKIEVPKFNRIFDELKKDCSRTIFSETGIKSNSKNFIKTLIKLNQESCEHQ